MHTDKEQPSSRRLLLCIHKFAREPCEPIITDESNANMQTTQYQWSSVTSNARFVLYARTWMTYMRICCFRRPHFVTEGICVWELRHQRKDWIVVQNMPDGLFKELLNSSSLLSFNCVSHGDMIYLSNRKSPQLIVIFNYAQNLWQRVDSCITHNLHPMYSWFSYYPRLDASI